MFPKYLGRKIKVECALEICFYIVSVALIYFKSNLGMSHSYNSYSVLKEKKVEIAEIVEWHCTRLLNNVKSNLKLKQRFRNPFTFNVVEPIKFSIFIQLFISIKDYRKGDGGTQPNVGITKKQKKTWNPDKNIYSYFHRFFFRVACIYQHEWTCWLTRFFKKN